MNKSPFTFEEKLSIAEEIGRGATRSEAAIARDRIFRAKLEFEQRMKDIEESFDCEAWAGIVDGFSFDELAQVRANLKHKQSYKEQLFNPLKIGL